MNKEDYKNYLSHHYLNKNIINIISEYIEFNLPYIKELISKTQYIKRSTDAWIFYNYNIKYNGDKGSFHIGYEIKIKYKTKVLISDWYISI